MLWMLRTSHYGMRQQPSARPKPTLKYFLNSSLSHKPTSARMAFPLASLAVLPFAKMSCMHN